MLSPPTLESINLEYINEPKQLESVINELKNSKEIGVDIICYTKCYKSVICLVQISSEIVDYTIDSIALAEDMGKLSVIFENEKIVKVVHSANNIIRYLQEDFGLVFKNMFDTRVAMKMLKYKKPDLGIVLEKKYGVKKSKRLGSRSDFRRRPLNKKLQDHARTTAHYLIYVYREFSSMLAEGQLALVKKECAEMCKMEFVKKNNNDDATTYDYVLKKINYKYARQCIILEELTNWRKNVAQENNKNKACILSRRAMLKLIEEIPHSEEAVLKICDSRFVKKDINKILTILKGKVSENST